MYHFNYLKLFVLLFFILIANPVFAQSDIVILVPNSSSQDVPSFECSTLCEVKLDANALKGDIIEYHWRSSDGKDAYGKTTTIPFNKSGIYTIALKVTDRNGCCNILGDIATVTVKNNPSACFSENVPDNKQPWQIALNADCSQIDITNYEWKVNGLVESFGQKTTLFFNKLGEYIVTLEVSNANGNDSTSKKVIIDEDGLTIEPITTETSISTDEVKWSEEEICLPIAKIQLPTSKDITPSTITLNGSGSKGDIVNYEWTASQENTSTQIPLVSSEHAVAPGRLEEPGTYNIFLTVTDSNTCHNTVQAENKVIVREPICDSPPVAVANVLPNEDKASLTVMLDGSGSSDKDGTITDYKWTASNGTELPSEKETSITFENSGTYIVSLVVTDNCDLQSEPSKVNVTIEAPPPVSPIPPTDTNPSTKPSPVPSIKIEPTKHSFPETFIINSNRNQPKSKPKTRTRPLNKADYWPGRVIVKFREGTQRSQRRFLRKRSKANVIKELSLINAEVWQVDDVEATIKAQYQRQRKGGYSDIEYIEPDYIIRATTNDEYFEQLWGLHNTGQTGGTNDADIDAPEAWEINPTNNPVICAVIDSGVDYNHPDLQNNMWKNPGEIEGDGIDNDSNGYTDDVYGYNFLDDNSSDPLDDCGHGTHVAGIMAAVGDNDVGVTGVNSSGKIMALKILKPELTLYGMECIGYDSDAIEALKYAKEMGVKCINNSWGGEPHSQALEDAIRSMGEVGQLFVAAAGNDFGNDNDTLPFYPASYDSDNIISVCSTDDKDELSAFSNVGLNTVDLCAPGSRIVSTDNTNVGSGYKIRNGTSMASAYVAGAAMLMWSAFPELTASDIKRYILITTDHPNADSLKLEDSLTGYSLTGGRLNVYKALTHTQTQQQTFIIENTSKVDLEIQGVELSGGNADEFQIRKSTCSFPQTLAPSETCTVDVWFTPQSIGSKKTTLTVSSNVEEGKSDVKLTGNATEGKTGSGTVSYNETRSVNLVTEEELPISSINPETKKIELMLPIVAIPNATGGFDIYGAKLCQMDGTLRFRLCDDDALSPEEPTENDKLGYTTFNVTTKIVNIPVIKVANIGIFEADLFMETINGDLEFVLINLIPIYRGGVQLKNED